MKKKLLAILLTVCMVVSMAPMALAASTTKCTGTCSHQAAIGSTHYDTLKEACDAAKDGDTVTLLSSITIDENTRYDSGNGWYEGVYYEGDKSFTIDLGGYTLTNTNAVNDYLMLFKNVDEKTNEITIKNGVINASDTYSAICTSGGSTRQITINLEDVTVTNTRTDGNGDVVRARGGAVVNVKDGAVITGNGVYVTVYSVKATVNIYDGAKIYMNDTTSYVGSVVGASNGGTVNAYGGYGKGTQGCFIVMTTGGTINVSGGEWIADSANTGKDGNYSVLISQNSTYETYWVAASIINVTGGTFTGKYNCYGVAVGDAQINISGGTFNNDPSAYLAMYHEAVLADGVYVVSEHFDAAIGDVKYHTLQNAFDAVQDGETITVLSNITFTTANVGYNANGWVDGVKYTGDKSFTVDFAGHTVTDDGCVNDYVIYLINQGSKANEITFTNGTIVSKNGCWSTVCVNGNSSIMKSVLNLNGMTITNSNGTGYGGNEAVRARERATVNVNSGTTLTSDNASYGIAAYTQNSTVNINSGATIIQKNSTNPGGNHTCAAVSGLGTVNIYDGAVITSDHHGVHPMTSANPVVNIYGGTITADVAALYATTNGGLGQKTTINVYGGTITGALETPYTNGYICVSGGTFSANPSAYCVAGYMAVSSAASGLYYVQEDPGAVMVAQLSNGVKYQSLQAAIDAAAVGNTVTLLRDVTLTETVTINKTLTLDLNGCTITNATTAPITVGGISKLTTVTVKDSSEGKTGTIVAANTTGENDNKAAILIAANYRGKFVLESGTLQSTKYGIRSTQGTSQIVINGGTIEGAQYGLISFKDTVVLNGGTINSGIWGVAAYGNFTMNGGTINAQAGYVSSGTRDYTVAVINGGTINASIYDGVYWPSAGSLTINGGSITGACGVYVKSGTVAITGGSITATGEKDDYAFEESGSVVTGDALVIENVGGTTGYEAITSVSVTGGTFTSANASAVASYAATAENADAVPVTGFISGGTYSDKSAASYLAEGYTLESYVNGEGKTVHGVEPVYTVTITIPDGATIVVKDSDGNVAAAEADGTYKLVNGTYTYTVSKPGYNTKTGSFTVTDAEVTVNVILSVYVPYVPTNPSYSVTVATVTNGSVSVSPANASSGTTVTITVDPDTGYVLETLTVVDQNGGIINLTYVSDGKYTFKMPTSKVSVYATFMEDNTMLNYFTDVFASDYYYNAVLWAVENGITTGTSATTFSPNMTCSRAQAVTFLWRAAGEPAPKSTEMPFTDVAEGSYYYNAVLWAVENGITTGTGATTFSPDADCTRAQIVTFLWRAQGSEDAVANNPFVDVADGAYYEEAVLWAVENGITTGTGASTFSPDADCVRGQIVTFLYRCLAE